MKHIVLAFFLLTSACSNAGMNDKDELGSVPDSSKILIVYLSRTNNTKAIAEIIQRNMIGTLIALMAYFYGDNLSSLSVK